MAKDTKKRGLFITFEGGEGAGKSTQIKRLEKKLEEANQNFIVTREPGGTPGAEAIRHVLLSGQAEHYGAEMEAMLFAAARSDHVASVIEPAISKGRIVICDRFIDSTRVYQGATGAVDMKFLHALEFIACDETMPDLTIVLDIDPKEGMKRANERRKDSDQPDRFEKENLKAQKKRHQAYLKIAKAEPDRCKVINANGTEAQVAARIWRAVKSKLEAA